jgi:hypothetical protein
MNANVAWLNVGLFALCFVAVGACHDEHREPARTASLGRSQQAVQTAGSADPEASFFGPTAVTEVILFEQTTSLEDFDLNGKPLLLVADTLNSTIREIQEGSGATTTLAGSPGIAGTTDGNGAAARFNKPQGLFNLSGGRVMISDTGNHVIRQLDLHSHDVITLAGQPGVAGSEDGPALTARFNHPRGVTVAWTGESSAVYIADTDSSTIRRLDLGAVNAVTTVAGGAGMLGDVNGAGSTARFRHPTALVTCQGGNGHDIVYIADTGNHTIRALDPASNQITLVAGVPGQYGYRDGSGPALFAKPIGLACAADQHLFVTDAGSHTVRLVDVTNGSAATVAGSAWEQGTTDATGDAARFRAPAGIAGASLGLVIADQGNHTLRVLDQGTHRVTTLVGLARRPGDSDGSAPGVNLGPVRHLLCDGQTIYADGSGINAIDIETGTTEQIAGTGLVTFMARVGNALYTDDGLSYVVRRLDLDTRDYRVFFGNGSDAQTNQFSGLTTMGETVFSVQVGDADGPAGAQLRAAHIVGTPSRFEDDGFIATVPNAIELANDGQVIYFTALGSALGSVDLSTHDVATLAGQPGGGYLDGPGSMARFRDPRGLAAANGQIYIADAGNQVIRKYDLQTGVVSTLAGVPGARGLVDGPSGVALFNSPSSVCVQGNNLYVADTANMALRKIDLTTGVVTTPVLQRLRNRCVNGFKDGDETGVDCGGSCAPCPEMQACRSSADCRSQNCVEGVCGATCFDGIRNGGESDVDCGASCRAVQQHCAIGKHCLSSGDCQSLSCVAGTCVASCTMDGIKNGDETDIDCGGSCAPCATGKHCSTGADCSSRVCSAGLCMARSCSDGVRNGTEIDVDCGPTCGNFCKLGQTCRGWPDCGSDDCEANVCVATCSDGVMNGSETGLDCGGGKCGPCPNGQPCNNDLDCASKICNQRSIDLPFAAPDAIIPTGECARARE